MTDGTWINKEAGWGVLPQLIPGQYGWTYKKARQSLQPLTPAWGDWVPHYRESYNIPDKVWDADSDAIYRESLPTSVNYRTWESTEAPVASNGAAVTTAPKNLLDTNGLVSYIMAGKAGNGPKRIQHLLGLGYSPEQVLAAQKVINRSMRRAPAPIPIKAPPTTPAQVLAATSTPKPEAQLAASLFKARQQSARNALGGLSPAEGVQRGIIPYEALAYF